MTKIFTLVNQKGGVGKTTLCVNMAYYFAVIRSYRTLVIDTDAQGNAGKRLGCANGNDLMRILSKDRTEPVTDLVYKGARENLDVIRSDRRTKDFKEVVVGYSLRDFIIGRMIQKFENYYDLVFIDCAPSTDTLTQAAIYAADYLLIPSKLDQDSFDGIRTLLQTLEGDDYKQYSSCQVGGIIPTFYETSTNESRLQKMNFEETYPVFMLPHIPTDTMIRENYRVGKTMFEYDPTARSVVGIKEKWNGYRGGFVELGEVIEDRFIKD